MSQNKVDRNKELKHNRKELVKKRKKQQRISLIATCCVAAVLLGWVGYSAYITHENNASSSVSYTYYDINTTAISDFLDAY